MNSSEALRPVPPFSGIAWLVLAVAAAGYAAFAINAGWTPGYIDFGDGNYLYIASRIADGAVVYRDILAPQPPMHLFTGAFLVKISQWAGAESALYVIRGFSLMLHLATFWVVADLARRAWGSSAAGAVAGVVFLVLPIGLWWSLAYQSEPLEIFFLVVMMEFALRRGRAADVMTGVFGALAALTNATAAPFLLVLIVYMLARNWKRALWIALPAIVFAGAVTLVLEVWTGGYFLQNVVLNQVGTYPKGRFWSYALGKIASEGADIFLLEGVFIIIAIFGLMRFFRESPIEAERRDGLAWFGIATMGSFVYVTKGGTMDYIYCLAGPALAIFGAGEWLAVGRKYLQPEADAPRDLSANLVRAFAIAFFALIALGPAARFYGNLLDQDAFELKDLSHATRPDGTVGPNVEQVVRWIERYSKPGDTILAPPYYAFLADRKLWGDYSELFIWRIKDYNDRLERNPEGEGWSKTRAMAEAIANRELPIVIIELGQQGELPEVRAALAEHYQSILEEPGYYETLNTRLGVYVPKQ